MLSDPVLIAVSFLVGVTIGLTSMGGAALMTPFLVLVLGVRPVLAVGTDLVFASLTKVFGSWAHWRQGTVDFRVALRLAAGSVPGVLLGARFIVWLRTRGMNADAAVRPAIGVALIFVAAVLLARVFWSGNLPFGAGLKSRERPATVAWGALVGFVVGLTSVGSGTLIAPFLLLLYPKSPARVVGTDIFHAMLLAGAGALFHAQAGNVDWRLLPVLLAGSLPGVMLGSYLAPRLPAKVLRIGMAAVLFVTGWKLV
jgi:uncharacterized membrane protein YfcA